MEWDDSIEITGIDYFDDDGDMCIECTECGKIEKGKKSIITGYDSAYCSNKCFQSACVRVARIFYG